MNPNIYKSFSIKVIFLGDNGVGKSAIIASIINGKTTLPENSSIFLKSFDKKDGGGEKVFINFQDAIKIENYNNLIHHKSTSGAIFVFDITNRSSFEKVNEIMKKIKENSYPSKINCLVGNKKDLD